MVVHELRELTQINRLGMNRMKGMTGMKRFTQIGWPGSNRTVIPGWRFNAGAPESSPGGSSPTPGGRNNLAQGAAQRNPGWGADNGVQAPEGRYKAWNLLGVGVAPDGAFLLYFVPWPRGSHPGLRCSAMRAVEGSWSPCSLCSLDASGVGYCRLGWIPGPLSLARLPRNDRLGRGVKGLDSE